MINKSTLSIIYGLVLAFVMVSETRPALDILRDGNYRGVPLMAIIVNPDKYMDMPVSVAGNIWVVGKNSEVIMGIDPESVKNVLTPHCVLLDFEKYPMPKHPIKWTNGEIYRIKGIVRPNKPSRSNVLDYCTCKIMVSNVHSYQKKDSNKDSKGQVAR